MCDDVQPHEFSMTQVQDDDEDDEGYYANKTKTLAGFGNDSDIISMTQVQADESSSDDDDEEEDGKVFAKPCAKVMSSTNNSTEHVTKQNEGVKNAPSPGTSDTLMSATTQNGNKNDAVVTTSIEEHLSPEKSKDDEDLSLFLSQTQNGDTHISDAGTEVSKGTKVGESASNDSELSLSLHFSPDEASIKNHPPSIEHFDSSSTVAAQGAKSVQDVKAANSHDINSKKKHAVSQISQLEIDYESECQIANMAEIAVREEVIPGQNDQMLPISQTQDICNKSTLKSGNDTQNSKKEYDWNAFKDLIAYVFQKIAFGKLKRSIKVLQSSTIHDNQTARDSSTGIITTQEPTQEHAFSAPSQQLSNNTISMRHTGLVGISHNAVDSQGMISLSYESSAYEESQSQAKLTVALNEKKTDSVPSILPKKGHTNTQVLVTSQEQSCVESSLPSSNAEKYRKHDFEQVVEETPQSLRESQNMVTENSERQLDFHGRKNALGAIGEQYNSGKWISTTKISKSKAQNVSSQDTEKIPLGRQIMVDSISPEDDEDDEISKIVRGSVSDGELEDEELPSETAVLDVSDGEVEDNSANLGKERSADDERAVLKIISHLFPEAREKDLGIKSFYLKVKTEYGKDLDDDIWIPFVWDSIFEMMNGLKNQVNSQSNREQFESSNFSDHDDNIPLSQVGVCGEMSQDVVAQDTASKVELLVDAATKPQLELHKEWSLAAHRHRRRKDNAEVSTSKDTNSDETKKKDDSAKPKPKRKRSESDAVTSKNPRVLADMIYKEDLADDFLVADKKWRDLFHILKQRGWKWKYGSGIVEKKYLAPGVTGKTGIIGTNIFLSPRSVVEFIRNSEPLPVEDKKRRNNAEGNCDSIVQATEVDKRSKKGAEDKELFSLLKQASLQINENASEPKSWGGIYSILKTRGWEYKKAPKSISLKCAWIFIEPTSGESEPIMHEGEAEAIKSLCRRFGIEVRSPTLETSRRRKRKSPQITTEDSQFENDLAKAIERSKKKPKVGLKASTHVQNANESLCNENKEKNEEAKVSTSSESVCKAGTLLAEEKRDLFKIAAEHDDISTDPPGWQEIFAALQDEGWYYKNSSSGLRAWDYVCPSEGDKKPVVYANPRAVARALCHKFGIIYNAPSESQENIRSRRSRRPPKRFASPSPKPKRVESEPTLPKNDVAAKEGKNINEQLASSPSNFVPNSKTRNKNSKKAKIQKKMFNGYHFMLSGLSIHTRKELKKAIKANGGFVYSEIAIFEKDMKECEKTPNEGEVSGMAAFVVLSLCEPSAYRKAKYLYSLAVGVPVVHYSWIYECLSKKMQISISKYVLPNGLSLIHEMYVFPAVPKEIDHDYHTCASNRMSKQEEVTQASLISPKPSQVVSAGIFNKMTLGLHIDSAKRRKDYLHTDWWYILNIAGALVYEGDMEYLKNAQVDAFICRMDDFSVLPELRKIANGKQVPIVTFEWCIQSLVNNKKLSFDAMPTFVAGKGGGSSHKGCSGSNIRLSSWASAMLTNIGHPQYKYFSAVRVNGVRYCIGDLVYMRKPWVTINRSVNEDEDSNLESDDCKYNYRLGIIDSFWETKKDGTKKVKWQSLDRVNAGNGNTVVATGEYVESPVDTMSKKFMLFDALECLEADNGNSLLPTVLPSASSVNSDVQFSRGNGYPPVATRLYFQIEDEEDEDYFEIVAEGKYDVYLMQQQRTN